MDPRLNCRFCHANHGVAEPATMVAPQHSGGDTDKPAEWVPVCDEHFNDWFDGIADDERLPAFNINQGVKQ